MRNNDDLKTRHFENTNPNNLNDSLPRVRLRLDKADVAALSVEQIRTMSRSRMMQAVRATALPAFVRLLENLRIWDAVALRNLVYQARRCCRNQGY